MWASAPTGVTGTRRPGGHTGCFSYHPVGADALVGPRPPSVTARAAPAEREHKGIRNFPRPKVSPRAPRLMKPKREKSNFLSPAAWRYALCADRSAVAIFSFGPSTAQPLAALPLTDAAYPLRVRPVFFLSRTKRKWGVDSSGDHRILRPIRTAFLSLPPEVRPAILLMGMHIRPGEIPVHQVDVVLVLEEVLRQRKLHRLHIGQIIP